MTLRRLAAWLWTAWILTLCWIPRSWLERGSSAVGGGFEFGQLNFDKAIHVVLFAVLVPLFTRAGWSLRAAALLGGAVAFISELGQSVPATGRTFHLVDLLCDITGIALGVAFVRRFPSLNRPAALALQEERSS